MCPGASLVLWLRHGALAASKELWLLIRGLASCFSTLFWAFVLLMLITYAFALCAMELIRPEAEKQEGELGTRLKIRQWTQKLVDHSLLLGSSTEGIHLHDIVLHYLRKRLSAGEMRKLHTQVVDGMVMASRERMSSIGASFEDTGSTVKPFEGEEIDWYW